ncbi:MAG: ArsB/NhaD family transporter [Bacillota bacterium]|nr:ArsB/NhaD family transporter [Bacillota bacterium]
METGQIIAVAVFILVMAAIISEKVHRTVAAMAGALCLVLLDILSIEDCVSHVDFNTIGVLTGMMIFVAVVKNSGIFEYLAIKSAKIAKGDPWKIMILFVLITAGFSAFLDNVTTVLLVGPMTITICRMLEINPIPFLMTQIMASNIGGTSTLIGDPPNIMIGSAAGLSFFDFIINVGPPILIILTAVIFCFRFIYGKHLKVEDSAKLAVFSLDEKKAIKDIKLLHKSIVMILLVVLGFMFHGALGIESCTVALSAAAIMLLIGKQSIEDTFAEIEWTTIIFFIGLFIVVGGMVEVGIIDSLANLLMEATNGELVLTTIVLLWVSAIVSSILDNIPFVATIIPIILTLEGSSVNVAPLWWAVSLGACLGGNGTLIGASANVVLSGISNNNGYPITFINYLKVGFPVMILTIVISTIYLLLRYAI